MFSRWRRRRVEQQVVQRLDEITQRLAQVLDKAAEHKVQVTIQHLHVEKATLDQLLFKLDQLDIDELSGSLNLGNNFGIDVLRSKKDVVRGGMGKQAFPGLTDADAPRQQPGDVAPPATGSDRAKIAATERGYTVCFGTEHTDPTAPVDPQL